jgi:hypothetical protein
MAVTGKRRQRRDQEGEARATLDARLDVLARSWAFRACSRKELERIDGLATEVRRPAGVIVQHAGRGVRQMIVVVEGAVIESAHGTTRTFGVEHLLGGEALRQRSAPAGASVATATPVRALVLGPAEIAEVSAMDGVQAVLSGRTARAAVRGAREALPAARRSGATWGATVPHLA